MNQDKNRDMTIFDSDSLVHFLEVNTYEELSNYCVNLSQDDVKLLETMRDWHCPVKITSRMRDLSRTLGIPRVKYMEMEWDCNLPAKIAEDGDLETLRHVHSYGCPWDGKTCKAAAGNGKVGCLEFAHANRCPWDESTTHYSLVMNQLSSFEYAVSNGCPLEDNVYLGAVHYGRLDFVKCLHSHGVPWHPSTLYHAIKYKRMDCWEFAMRNGCPKMTEEMKKNLIELKSNAGWFY